MNLNLKLEEKILEILKEYDDYVSSEIFYEKIANLSEKDLNGHIVLLEKEELVKVKVGVDSKFFKVKLK